MPQRFPNPRSRRRGVAGSDARVRRRQPRRVLLMADLVFEARQSLARLVHNWPARVSGRTVDRARERYDRRLAQREAGDPLGMDELSEEWLPVERAIWPDGPANGHGSGASA